MIKTELNIQDSIAETLLITLYTKSVETKNRRRIYSMNSKAGGKWDLFYQR